MKPADMLTAPVKVAFAVTDAAFSVAETTVSISRRAADNVAGEVSSALGIERPAPLLTPTNPLDQSLAELSSLLAAVNGTFSRIQTPRSQTKPGILDQLNAVIPSAPKPQTGNPLEEVFAEGGVLSQLFSDVSGYGRPAVPETSDPQDTARALGGAVGELDARVAAVTDAASQLAAAIDQLASSVRPIKTLVDRLPQPDSDPDPTETD